MSLKPHKKYTNVVCDVCDLAWDDHVPDDDGKVDVSECVRLLKAKIPTPRPWYQPLPNTLLGGYTCSCGVWVVYGTLHQCFRYPAYPYPIYTTSGNTSTQAAYSLNTESMCATVSSVSS